MRALFVAGLVGCAVSGVKDAPDAPFSLRGARWFWVPDGDDPRAVRLIGTRDHECPDVRGAALFGLGDMLVFDLLDDGDGYDLLGATAHSGGFGFALDDPRLTFDASQTPIRGELETRYWSGSFAARVCEGRDDGRELGDVGVRPPDTDPPDTDEPVDGFVDDRVDPGGREGPLLITSVSVSCAPDMGEDGVWSYGARTNGWTSDGLLFVDQAAANPWSEEHTLRSVDYCDDGTCDILERSLEGVFDWRDQAVDWTTLFDCDATMVGTMMWMAWVFDLDGNLADCVVWGADVSIYQEWGCADANGW